MYSTGFSTFLLSSLKALMRITLTSSSPPFLKEQISSRPPPHRRSQVIFTPHHDQGIFIQQVTSPGLSKQNLLQRSIIGNVWGYKCKAPAKCFHICGHKFSQYLGCLWYFYVAPLSSQVMPNHARQKVEGLPDNYQSEPKCKQFLIHALKLWR